MKGLYIANIDPHNSVGYMTKLLGQVYGFRQMGIDMGLLCFDTESEPKLIHNVKDLEHYDESASCRQNGKSVLSRRISLLKETVIYIKSETPDFIYLRYPRSEPIYIYFLRKIRKSFPDLIILSEFPTFPYDEEYKGTKSRKERLVFLLDKLTRPYLKYLVHRAISINYERPIFGIHTVSIDNGVTVDSYKCIEQRISMQPMKFIGVANVSSWHGYDRIIRGLSQYYRKEKPASQKIEFHIVGARKPYLNELRATTVREDLEDVVIFHPPKQGAELDYLFEECCLAIGVLGGHRKKIGVMSPLKNREYCARGIPFIFSHIDPDFSNDFAYALQVESSEDAVNIDDLIYFLKHLKGERISSDMRNYAKEKLDWPIKLKPVVAYLSNQINSLRNSKK